MCQVLSKDEFRILREKGTERAFTGKYWDSKAKGVYSCAGCGQALFSSEHKFRSGTGWPSFYQALSAEAVEQERDESLWMTRTEIVCSRATTGTSATSSRRTAADGRAVLRQRHGAELHSRRGAK